MSYLIKQKQKHMKSDEDEGRMTRPAEAENQREGDESQYFGKYLTGAGTQLGKASGSAIKGNAMFSRGDMWKYK
jgi:hypothetical protein